MRSLTEKVARKIAQILLRFARNEHDQDSPTSQTIKFQDPATWLPVNVPPEFYPYHFITPDALRQELTFDADGLPLRHKSDHRSYRNPALVAYWGLVHLNQFAQNKSDASRDTAIKSAALLESIARIDGDHLFLEYPIDLPRMHVSSPWNSALAQGLAGSLWIRLYLLSNDIRFLDLARKNVAVLTLPVNKGGVVTKTKEALDWMEEYPGKKATHVLNGFLFALIAMIEISSIDAKALIPHLHHFIRSLEVAFLMYRKGHYLLYDRLHADLCNPHYMGLHTLLFYHLFHLTHDKAFLELSRNIETDTDWILYARSIHNTDIQGMSAWINAHIAANEKQPTNP